jgi:hypothetical protein
MFRFIKDDDKILIGWNLGANGFVDCFDIQG